MKVLILSPHTDDAELGCGGSIVKLLEEDNDLFWIVFSSAEDSMPHGLPKETLKNEYYNVITDLGINKEQCKVFDFQVRNLHNFRQEILEDLIQTRNTFQPNLVIGPSLNDLHQDHQVVALEMVRAFKTLSSIICYELPWNHITFNTQCFIKLNKDHMCKKWSLLKNYKSQYLLKKPYFSEDYIFGLANTRGIQCQTHYAEAFEVIRWMV